MNLRLRRLRHRWPRLAIATLLAAWAMGLVFATVRLSAWQHDLTQVLLQMRADDLLRSSVRARDQVHPAWYRQRALDLLGAVERLRDNRVWTLVMPGSWGLFDTLQAQAAARVDATFGEWVVETIRRELESRAAAWAGARLDVATGEIAQAAGCAPARNASPAPVAATSAQSLPEYTQLARMLDAAAGVDRAAASLLALGQPDRARPEDLRMLIQYTLGADLSAPATRSLARFRTQLPPEAAHALASRLRWAMDCGLTHAMDALTARSGAGHELLVLEDQLAQLRPAALFQPAGPAGFGEGVARLRTTAALLARQEALLVRAAPDWMHADDGLLDPALEHLLRRVHDLQLLGPEAAMRQRARARAGLRNLHQRVQSHLARPDAGLVWLAEERRLAPSAQRLALRRGIDRLLQASFMAPDAPQAQHVAWATPQALDELAALAIQRQEFLREGLPRFPAALRPAVARYVDERVGRLAFEWAGQFVTAGVAGAPFDPLSIAWGRIRAAEFTVAEGGAAAIARRMRVRLEQEVLPPLLQATAGEAPAVMGAPPAPPAD